MRQHPCEFVLHSEQLPVILTLTPTKSYLECRIQNLAWLISEENSPPPIRNGWANLLLLPCAALNDLAFEWVQSCTADWAPATTTRCAQHARTTNTLARWMAEAMDAWLQRASAHSTSAFQERVQRSDVTDAGASADSSAPPARASRRVASVVYCSRILLSWRVSSHYSSIRCGTKRRVGTREAVAV